MATAHYNTTFTSTAERGYQTSYHGVGSRQRIKHYIGGYVKAYAHLTTVAYAGVYTKTYDHAWAKVFTGYYTKAYVGQYTKAYEGNWTGTYNAQYAKQYNKLWSHLWVKAYHKTWAGQYTKTYYKAYTGYYANTYLNANAYNIQYTGYYTGYFARDGIGAYTKAYAQQFGGSRDYTAQYANQFTGYFTGQYEGYFTKQYAGTWHANWHKQWSKNYNKVYNSYSDQFGTRYEQFGGSREFSAQYAGSRTHAYGGSRSYQITTTATYAGTNYAKQYAGTRSSGPTTFWGPRVWYVNFHPYILYDYEPRAWTGSQRSFAGQYESQYNTNYTGTASPTSVATYANPGGGASYGGFYQGTTIVANGQQFMGVSAWYEDFGTIWTPTPFSGPGYPNYGGSYVAPANYIKQWTTATVYSAQYSGFYDGQYAGSRTYSGQYANSFAIENYYIGPDNSVNYTKQYDAYYKGADYSGIWEKAYTGNRDHTYSKQFDNQFAGSRQYAGQYTGYFENTYYQNWSQAFEGQYSGPQFYGGKTINANFNKAWTGYYDKGWDNQYTGYFDAYYERGYEKQYANTYEKLYAGNREHTYVGYYDGTYEGYYDRAWAGNYGNFYLGYYDGHYTGYYSRNYVGYYSKGYTGTYAGGPSYTAIQNYTKTYSGVIPYNSVFVGASADGLKSGELTTEGVAKIKSGGTWKQAKELFIKKNGAWAESKAVFTKKDNAWEIVHIGWERTDININSNKTAFSLFSELSNLGKSPGTRPQLVNIYVNSGAVLSYIESVPAIDLTASMGTINIGGTSIKHLVRIFVHPNGRIIGASGTAGARSGAQSGSSGGNGGDAIKTNAAIELYIENYGIIAGGGGGGGAGGYPVHGATTGIMGGVGGVGAGFAVLNGSYGVDIIESDSRINGTNASTSLGIHGGSGGLLGQRGSGAGGYDHPGGNIANPGTLKSQYDLSGDGGLPGSAIVGYDATRVTFINTGNIWGDSKYKFT